MLAARCRKVAIPAALATALAVAAPLIPVSAAQASRTANPQVFSGTVLTTSGQPASGMKVKVYAMPSTAGRSGTLIGTATTAKNGTWSLTAPAYAALPRAAQQAALANMGYLNTDAIVNSPSSFAVAIESAWVGTPALQTETSSDTPTPMTMQLTAMTGNTTTPNCCGRFGCYGPDLVKVLGRSHSYTAVDEWHAYWDASGGLSYTRGATSNIGGYASISGGPFTFGGYDQFSTSHSLTMGLPSNGPHNSHQMVISMKYLKGRYVLRSNTTNDVCRVWRQIDENGLYDPGHGFELWKPGKNVIKDDGPNRYLYERRHHPAFIDTVPRGGGFSLTQGSALTYGGSASVFGIGIKAETSHSQAVAQGYTAGTSRRRHHFVWGNDGNLAGNPQVEYSY